MYDKDFELDEFLFSENGKDYYCSLHGNANWDVNNDSFDYAGTHCTHGKSGTHHLPDYAEINELSLGEIHVYFDVYDEYSGSTFEAERKFRWRFEKDREFIQKFEKEYHTPIMEMLQEIEDDGGSVMKSIHEYAEEMKYGI